MKTSNYAEEEEWSPNHVLNGIKEASLQRLNSIIFKSKSIEGKTKREKKESSYSNKYHLLS